MLDRLIKNINSARGSLTDYALAAIDEKETEIRELIHLQLRKGLRGDGQKITPDYSEGYAKRKGRTIPDLKVSGQYWGSIKTAIRNDIIDVTGERKSKSFDVAEHLELRYTSKILELTPESMKKLAPKIWEIIIKKIHDEINK